MQLIWGLKLFRIIQDSRWQQILLPILLITVLKSIFFLSWDTDILYFIKITRSGVLWTWRHSEVWIHACTVFAQELMRLSLQGNIVLKIIWPMKTLILNVLLKITQNILTFCRMYEDVFKEGKNTLLHHLKTCFKFSGICYWASLLSCLTQCCPGPLINQ